MKPKSSLRHFVLAAGGSLLAVSSASAVNYTWGGGNLLWNNTSTSGWNGGPPLAADTATINSGTATFAVNDTYGNAANTSSAAITVNTGGTLASGNRFNSLWNLALGGGTLLSNGGVNASFGTYNLAGTVSASGGVTSSISSGTGSFNVINLGNGASPAVTNTTFNVGAAGTLNVNTVLQNHRYFTSTTFTSVAGLIKTGDGQMNLSATNTYSGATTVSAGTLYVTGALSSSAVTVASTGTIGRNGAATGGLGNGLTIQAGGNLDLTGATLGANSSGILGITGGTLTLGNLAFTDLIGWDYANAALGTYELIDGGFTVDFGSTAFISPATAFDFGNGKFGYFTSGSLNAVIIPEPSAALLGGLGLLALLHRRR